MKIKSVLIALMFVLWTNLPSYSFIKLDEKSIDIAINYSIKMNDFSLDQILDKNWMNDGTGRILSIYSPFIQLVMKANKQRLTDSSNEENIKNIKNSLNSYIQKTKERNEVRFVISLYGDDKDFSKNYKAFISIVEPNNKERRIKPLKVSLQKEAQKDNFNPEHPYSAVNCYTFKFDDLFKLKDYCFILVSSTGETVKYQINSSEVY